MVIVFLFWKNKLHYRRQLHRMEILLGYGRAGKSKVKVTFLEILVPEAWPQTCLGLLILCDLEETI
jgi:hypothetical protein